jgi:hypothetical protein
VPTRYATGARRASPAQRRPQQAYDRHRAITRSLQHPAIVAAEEAGMSVMVILEMDGEPDALLAAITELEARRPTSAVAARVVAATDGGVVMCTVWESAAARDAYQSEPEHLEALQASGLRDAVTDMRSRVFENAELSLR